MQFILRIELGNESMRTKSHLLRALLQVRQSIHREMDLRDKRVGANQAPVYDLNGNKVGKWEVSE